MTVFHIGAAGRKNMAMEGAMVIAANHKDAKAVFLVPRRRSMKGSADVPIIEVIKHPA